MRPFFRRRSINALSFRDDPFLTGPLIFKSVIVLTALTFVFFFQLWAAKQRESFPIDPPDRPAESLFPTPSDKKNPGPIDINTASSDVLQSLPGIGPRTADEIVRRRSRFGPFREIDDLLEIKGIGPKKAARLRPYIQFAGSAGKENVD